MATFRDALCVLVAGMPLLTGSLGGQAVLGQSPGWMPALGTGPGSSDVYCGCVFDLDGSGPGGAVPLIGTDYGVLARVDGAWIKVGDLGGRVNALTVVDTDGAGPATPQLFAGGSFASFQGDGFDRVARWSGSEWEPLGSGTSATVRSLVSYDPDGDGPLHARLIVGGDFITAGGLNGVGGVAQWSGGAWSPLGTGVSGGTVKALTMLDPDGAGPQLPQLVAGGSFTAVNGLPTSGVARWDGSSWIPIGGPPVTGSASRVEALLAFDVDGPGPGPTELFVGGEFTTLENGSPLSRIARWTGSAWSPIGVGMNDGVYCLGSYDADGDGPGLAQLIAGGEFGFAGTVEARSIARWTGTAWAPLGSGLLTNGNVYSLFQHDLDGPGVQTPVLIAGGVFNNAGGVVANKIASWDGSAWASITGGVDWIVNALTVHDPDGSGPAAAQLISAGRFNTAGNTAASRVARWDSSGWASMGSGLNNEAFALTSHDADGAGPVSPVLVAGGQFTNAGGVSAFRVAQWNGAAWSPLGSGLNGRCYALASFDPDGGGPALPLLVAGGNFSMAGGVSAVNVAAYQGSAWSAMGNGLNGQVQALTVFDPDGSGPQSAQLIAGGFFTASGGTSCARIARWDGTSWSPLGSGMNGVVNALTMFDPEGPGSQPTQLIAAGDFSTAGGATTNRIARWDGAAWSPLGTGTDDSNMGGSFWDVFALSTCDPDGGGPLPQVLAVGGQFNAAGGVAVNGVALWNGVAWSALESGTNGWVNALTAHDPDGAGPLLPRLIVGGDFDVAGRYASPHIAAWGIAESTEPPPACSVDLGITGGIPGQDGLLDNNDFIVFINYFFVADPIADLGRAGGELGSDGQFDNNDFIVFISEFFACG